MVFGRKNEKAEEKEVYIEKQDNKSSLVAGIPFLYYTPFILLTCSKDPIGVCIIISLNIVLDIHLRSLVILAKH